MKYAFRASVCASMFSVAVQAQIVISGLSTPYAQDFDTLANSGTSTTVPTGWAFSEAGTAANTIYNSGTGSSTTGDTYSFGSAASTDRAFGGLQSGTLIPTIGAQFLNSSGQMITDLQVSYTGEQWRLGSASRADRMDFQYSLDATSLTTGAWSDFDTLDFSSPNTLTTGALNGNSATNQTALSGTISGLSVADGANFWIRWTDFNASGSDDGLAVDNFQLTAVPEPHQYALVAGLGLLGFAAYRRFSLKRV